MNFFLQLKKLLNTIPPALTPVGKNLKMIQQVPDFLQQISDAPLCMNYIGPYRRGKNK